MSAKIDDPMTANRRRQLRRWIDVKFSGRQTEFIASTYDPETDKQINQGELSGLLKNKSFREVRARNLEKQGHMPPDYLDSTSDPNDATMIRFVAEPTVGGRAAPPRITWPFVRASYGRFGALRIKLGPKRYNEAITELDGYLDGMLIKWEREAAEKRA